ncbi:hypothetical protein ACTL6U_11925 [Rhodovibrionaceae bacterium A322]
MKSGRADGDATRVSSFNKDNKHPYYVRVDESTAEIYYGVFMVNPTVEIRSWADLKEGGYRVGYLGGVKHLENNLIGLIEPGRLFVQPNSNLYGLLQLAHGRIDAYVYSNSATAKKDLASDRLKDSGIALAGIVDTKGLYPYFQIKHQALAGELAKAIRDIKAEGLLDEYLVQAETS